MIVLHLFTYNNLHMITCNMYFDKKSHCLLTLSVKICKNSPLRCELKAIGWMVPCPRCYCRPTIDVIFVLPCVRKLVIATVQYDWNNFQVQLHSSGDLT